MTTHTRHRQDGRLSLISDDWRTRIIRYFPVWLFGAWVFALIFPYLLSAMIDGVTHTMRSIPGAASAAAAFTLDFGHGVLLNVGDTVENIGELAITLTTGEPPAQTSPGVIAPLFTQEIAHWERNINRWANQYDLDPNLLATVMQIESCGHPTVSSSAGAQGLFQVMPFHFGSAEDQLDPDTNAMRGASVLNTCLDMASGDPGMAMACYNGGPSVLYQDFNSWLAEPQRYYRWGTGIYTDALQNNPTSPTLDAWLAAGGGTLCQMAATELGITP